MSIPTVSFRCDSCDYRGATHPLFDDFSYRTAPGDYSVGRTLSWCHSCQALAPVEDFGDLKALERHLEEAAQELNAKCWKSRKWVSGQLQECIFRMRLLNDRKGSERCLICGSKEVVDFDASYHWGDGSREVTEDQPTGFKHPDCGGEIVAQGSSLRFSLRRERKYFSADGLEIKMDENACF